MSVIKHFKMILSAFKDFAPVLTSGVLTVAFVSCIFFVIQIYFNLTRGVFSVGASVFQHGHIHRLFMYPLYHKTFDQLVLNITALVFLSGSLEKGVGTVRFLLFFLLLSTTTGLFYSFLDLLQNDYIQGHTEGLVPVTLACVALTTMHTKMNKSFLCGFSFPSMALPWVFLIITSALIPHSVLPFNIIGILTGWMYGRGWFSILHMSEARAGAVEKMMPFRLLRSITTVVFVPASTEEKRKILLPKINLTPASYPVQIYAPLSSMNTADITAKMHEGWPHSAISFSSSTPLPNIHGHGQNFTSQTISNVQP
ncbi:rhomboid domain-containing protein 2 [Mugil cephalus]|uniref:rhomboid domain-containing protein 2 n=1 Tax=Mugil cephalus TaxID=48193 RepID=UPI001FB767D3|nr:rhomboid domain-containing protein 2 [Mugil cephalus]